LTRPVRHQANVLGALALTLSDQMTSAIATATGQSVSAAAALSALAEFLDAPTVDRLAQVLGLTHSGAVRLVDRLAQDGLVARGPGDDRRSRSITLTSAGREMAAQACDARAGVLERGLSELNDAERQTLDALMARVMTGVVNAKDGGAWICRLCDFDACERAAGHCPAMAAALAKHQQMT
jgi:DNA-binding MarR family transcriptional regulator